MTDTVIQIPPTIAVLTPLALAKMSNHFHVASEKHDTGDEKISLFRYYLFCVAIELGLKAAILSVDCTDEKKELNKKIGHDLLRAIEVCKEGFDLSFLDAEEVESIGAINNYFKGKDLEYFTLDMLISCLKGYKDLPSIESIESASTKINSFIHAQNMFIDAKTSQEAGGGIISFV